MATALTDTPPAPSPYDAQVEAQLGKAAGKIRAHDLLSGSLALAVLTLGYAVAGILLDRWLDLPEWVRQLGLLGFVGLFLAVGYFVLLRPLRRAINPRYAARRVEQTVPDAKNAVINWVDLRDEGLPDTVRKAVGARALDGVADADVNKVGESRRLVWLGSAAGLLAATLALLFVLLKPAPFLSLVGRTFNPFHSATIATRTTIEVREPAGGDASLTSGDPLRVFVFVGGTVPEPDAPDRLRLQVRYTQESAEYDDLPLEQAGAAREWAIQVPQSVIQNGLWYRVAGGDALTPEYRVTVRSRPLVKGFEAEYEYPAYTRMKKDVGREPRLEAYRGTQVTLTVATNRQLKSGWMQVTGQPEPIRADVVGENKDAMRFRLTLDRTGTYRVGFTSADGEPSEPTPAYPIKVLADQPPTVVIDPLPPEEEGKPIPANGQLKVNGTIGDDFGIDTATLRLRLYAGTAATDLAARPYRDGKSFRREADNTWPTTLQYKDSVELPALKDAKGQPITPADGMELEYWLEATDNCTVPKPNVGRSTPKRVKIGPVETQPEQQQRQQQARQDRRQEEQQHQQQQDQQLQGERRDTPPPLHKDEPPPDQNQQRNQTGESQPQSKEQTGQPKPGNAGQKPPEGQAEPKQGNTGNDPMTPPDRPMTPDQPKGPPKPPENTGNPTGNPEPMPGGTPPPMDQPQPKGGPDQATPKPGNQGTPPPTDPKVQQQADKVRDAIEQQEQQPGQARPQPQEQPDPKAAQPPADAKRGGNPQDGSQAEPKGGESADPKGGSPSAPKDAGKLDKPDPAQPKPSPTTQPNGTPDQPPSDPAAGPQKGQPREGPAGEQKPGQPQQAEPNPAGATRPPEPKTTPDGGSPDSKSGASAGQPKGKPDSSRGQDKPVPSSGDQPPAAERPADGKGPAPTAPAQPKRPPTGAGEPEKTPGGQPRQPAEAKPTPGGSGSDPMKPENTPSAAKPEGTKPTGTAEDKGATKPASGEKKVDPKEIEQAVKDLQSGDEGKKQAARDKLDQAVGKDARQEVEKTMQDLKSPDPKTREAAEKKVQDWAKQAQDRANKDGQGQAKQPSPEEVKKWADKARDLASDDPKKREAAEKEFDDKLGKAGREQLQKDVKDITSGDKAKEEAARKRLEEQAKQAGQSGAKPSKEEQEKWAEKAKDLNSTDPQKKQAAEKDFDKQLGQAQREQLQKDLKDLNSGDKDKQAAAQKKLEEKAKEAAGQGSQGQPQKPSKEDIEKLAQKAKDLASDDKAKREAAEKEFDQAIGKENREQLQQNVKDLASGDKEKQAAAQKRLEEMAKKADPTGKDQPPSKEELEKLAEKAQDLNSPDPQTKQAAEKAFDDKLGKQAREELQQNLKDLRSKDQAKQDAARKKLEDMAKSAGGKGEGKQPNPLSKADVEKLAQQAKDLASPDEARRKAAEEAFDQKVGKDVRDRVQKEMKDLNSDDPKTREDAQKRLEEMAKNLPRNADDRSKDWRPGGAKPDREGKTLDDNPANRLKTNELQLQQFEKNRYNKDLQNKLGYTQEEYDEFLKGFREMVARQRDEVAKGGEQPKTETPTGPATVKVGEGSRGAALEKRGDGTNAQGGAAGTGTAPPGYSDAQRKFAEEAARLKQKEGKK